jgi:uncharacterized protein (DUF2267 family)
MFTDPAQLYRLVSFGSTTEEDLLLEEVRPMLERILAVSTKSEAWHMVSTVLVENRSWLSIAAAFNGEAALPVFSHEEDCRYVS